MALYLPQAPPAQSVKILIYHKLSNQSNSVPFPGRERANDSISVKQMTRCRYVMDTSLQSHKHVVLQYLAIYLHTTLQWQLL